MRNLLVACLVVLGLSSGIVPEAFAQGAPPVPRPERKGKKYTVKIDSSPQQAAIYLDDKQYGIVGYTPFTGKLVRGDYKLIIELQGYKPIERAIRVDSKNKSQFMPLERQVSPGTIDVQAVADPNLIGATVHVDAQPQGSAPVAVDVAVGRHLVEIKKAGFVDFAQWVDVKEGQRVTLAPVLRTDKKATGSLLIDADTPAAEVYIDGKKHSDPTPTVVDTLEEGPHIVEVRKEPAMPWKQTVYVSSGQRTKVTAQLAATLQQSQGGTIRVLSNVENAEIFLDGMPKGKVPGDVKDVTAGVHIIEVRAPGYDAKEERVTINAGQATILKVELQTAIPAGSMAKIKVVSPVPEAKVFIDGASVGTAPVDKDLMAGEHFVVVEKDGFAKFEVKLRLKGGEIRTVKAELQASGTLRFLSNIAAAEIVLDGEPVGQTPLVKSDVQVGDHVITIRKAGYYDFEQAVKVEGGKLAIINADLRIIDTGPTAEDIERMKRGLSSFGARTIPFGRFTADMMLGYPYYVQGRATVGVKDTAAYGFDVGVGIRSMGTTWEFLLHSRYRFIQREPFSLAAFGQVGGGGGFSGRNEFSADVGTVASITFRNLVTVSGRAYLNAWSDRLCGIAEKGDADGIPDDGPGVCTTEQTAEQRARATQLLDREIATPADLQERDSFVRFYLSAIVEAAVTKRFNLFVLFEGAPFQRERAIFTDTFNGSLFAEDPIYNGSAGISAKF